MSDSTDTPWKGYEDAIVIDACAISVVGWHERIEQSGATVLQTSATWPRDDAAVALGRIQAHRELLRSDERFAIVESIDDIHACKRDGKVGIVLNGANTDMLGRDPGLVEVFRDVGIRTMQLNYNERNLASDGCLETSNAGLSYLGLEFVQAMNEAGIVIDVADASINSSLEAIEASELPCVFSHNNPRATAYEQQRNVTDEQIQELAAKGGVIALPVHAPLCATELGRWPTIDDYITHIEHVVNLVGIDHVGIGSDSEAVPGGVDPAQAQQMGRASRMNVGAKFSIGEVSRSLGFAKERTRPLTYLELAEALQRGDWGAKGIETLAKLPALAAKLHTQGWSDEDLTKLFGGNLLRVYAANWDQAQR